jgi:hypothetical protein
MKDHRKIEVKARGVQVNTNQRGTQEQPEGKEWETRRREVENMKTTTKCKTFMKFIWKIHEAVGGKGPLS